MSSEHAEEKPKQTRAEKEAQEAKADAAVPSQTHRQRQTDTPQKGHGAMAWRD